LVPASPERERSEFCFDQTSGSWTCVPVSSEDYQRYEVGDRIQLGQPARRARRHHQPLIRETSMTVITGILNPPDVDRLRAAIDAVAQERNSGDGTVSSGHVDELLAAAAAVLPPPTGTCELCGSAGVPVQIGTDPDPRVPQVVCRDLAACQQACEDDEVRERTGRTYTHPDVLTIGVRDGWADPQTDPTRIDWAARQATAAIPFRRGVPE
jgi:hypothetical protein